MHNSTESNFNSQPGKNYINPVLLSVSQDNMDLGLQDIAAAAYQHNININTTAIPPPNFYNVSSFSLSEKTEAKYRCDAAVFCSIVLVQPQMRLILNMTW